MEVQSYGTRLFDLFSVSNFVQLLNLLCETLASKYYHHLERSWGIIQKWSILVFCGQKTERVQFVGIVWLNMGVKSTFFKVEKFFNRWFQLYWVLFLPLFFTSLAQIGSLCVVFKVFISMAFQKQDVWKKANYLLYCNFTISLLEHNYLYWNISLAPFQNIGVTYYV